MYAEKPAVIGIYLGQRSIAKRTKKIKLVEWTDTLEKMYKRSEKKMMK